MSLLDLSQLFEPGDLGQAIAVLMAAISPTDCAEAQARPVPPTAPVAGLPKSATTAAELPVSAASPPTSVLSPVSTPSGVGGHQTPAETPRQEEPCGS